MLNQTAINDSKGESFLLDFNLKDVTYAIEVEISPENVLIKRACNLNLCTYHWFAPGWGGGGGGVGQPRGIRPRKAHMGWDFGIHNDPRGGKFDSTAILKS